MSATAALEAKITKLQSENMELDGAVDAAREALASLQEHSAENARNAAAMLEREQEKVVEHMKSKWEAKVTAAEERASDAERKAAAAASEAASALEEADAAKSAASSATADLESQVSALQRELSSADGKISAAAAEVAAAMAEADAAKSQASSAGGELEARVAACLLYTSPSPRDATLSRMPSSA